MSNWQSMTHQCQDDISTLTSRLPHLEAKKTWIWIQSGQWDHVASSLEHWVLMWKPRTWTTAVLRYLTKRGFWLGKETLVLCFYSTILNRALKPVDWLVAYLKSSRYGKQERVHESNSMEKLLKFWIRSSLLNSLALEHNSNGSLKPFAA